MERTSSKKGKIKLEISAGGVVYKKTNKGIKILLIKDSYGRWTLPKGKIEKDETPEQAALREIGEETGLSKIKIIDKLDKINYYYRQKNQLIYKTVYHFLIEGDNEQLAPNYEIQDAQWFDIDEGIKRIAYKNTKNILKIARKKLMEASNDSIR